jgi:COP9 signalosome complex subunit 2
MLDYTRAAVTRNQSEKKINSLLDHVAASTDMRLLQARGACDTDVDALQHAYCALCSMRGNAALLSGAIVGMRLISRLPRAQEFYGITLEALAEAKNDRLWFKTQLKLCSLWLRLREYSRATKLLKELHRRAGQPAMCSPAAACHGNRRAAACACCV